MAGQPLLELKELAQEPLFRLGEPCHRDRALPAAQHRAKRDHKEFVEIMQFGIAGARIIKSFPAGDEFFHGIPPKGENPPSKRRIHRNRKRK